MWEDLPLVIFGTAFSIICLIFALGALLLVFTKDIKKVEKGRKIVIKSIYGFSAILLASIVFFSISYFLEKPAQEKGEIPPAPVSSFPPGPEL